MDNTTLDPQAINLAKAIRQTETGGNFNAQGKSGEWGAYQFRQPTWQTLNQKYGTNYQFGQATPEQQNELAYKQIKEWKDSGYNVGQIASMWNAGQDKPNAYLEGNTGVNRQGVRFDTGAYAKSVANAYQTLKNGGNVGMDINNPSSISGTQVQKTPSAYGSSFPASSNDTLLGGLGKAVGNIPSSALNLGKNIAGTFLHPIKTIEGLANISIGAGEELAATATGGPHLDTPQTQAFHGLVDFFKNRYGSLDNIRKTVENDPVGFALDVSLALQAGGSALKSAGIAGQTSEIADLTEGLSEADKASAVANLINEGSLGPVAQTGQTISDIGNKINPLRIAGEGISKLAHKGAKLMAGPLGIETGTGGQALKEFYNSVSEGGDQEQAATEGLRGNVSPEELVSKSRNALNEVIENRNKSYQNMLAPLEQEQEIIPATAETPIEERFISPDRISSRLNDIVGPPNSSAFLKTLRDSNPEIAQKILDSVQPGENIHNWDEFEAAVRQSLTPEEGQIANKDILRTIGDMKHTDAMLSEMEGGSSRGYVTYKVPPIDISPIENEFYNQLKRFRIGIADDGSLDFGNSSLRYDASAQNTIGKVWEDVQKLGSGEADTSPLGIDALKRSFGSLDNPSSATRAFTTPMYQAARQALDQVPGYTKGMDDYSETTKWLDDTRKALSLGDTATADTTFRKLISVLRNNNDLRAQAVKELDLATKGTLLPSIAGQQLSSLVPRGLAQFGDIFAIGEAFHGVGILPVLAQLMISSPRLVGEGLRALGIAGNKLQPVMQVLSKFSPEVLGGANVISNAKPPVSAFSSGINQ